MKNTPLPQNLRERGLSLVLVLFAIVALSSLIVLYFSLATNDRAGTAAYTSTLKAEEIGTGGLELVIEELRKEIADEAKSTIIQGANGGPSVFLPLTRQDILPQRTVTGTSPNLLKTSFRNTPLFTGTGASLIGSLSPSITPSGNGRAMTVERWNRPELVDFTTAMVRPPDWIYLGRQGPLVDPPLSSASDAKSPNFVTGRFAFAIYDMGGLLDVNVAGFPAELPAVKAGEKGSIALARLQALGLTDAQVEAIIAFRNPRSREKYPTADSTYLDYIQAGEAHDGFTKTIPGDNRFLSRQELIRFAKRNNFENKLELLTTFSREKNAPSYAPDPALPPQTADPAINTSLAAARHGNSGLLLFEKRFPLSRLALLAQLRANPSDETLQDQVKDYFGLEYTPGDVSGNPRHRTFTYVGHDTDPPTHIKTLAEIGAELNYRAPDFFETLKAVILAGSLGQSAGTTASVPYQDSADFHVIRIGANAIDQYDEDYIPTPIYFTQTPPDLPVWGIENLPYANKIQVIAQYPAQGNFSSGESPSAQNPTPAPDSKYYFRWAVELWNPHIQNYPVTNTPGPNIKVALGPVGALARVDMCANFVADLTQPGKVDGTPKAINVAEHSNEINIATGYARGTPSAATMYRYFADPRQVFFGTINQEGLTRETGFTSYASAVLQVLGDLHVDLSVRGPDDFLHRYFRTWNINNAPLVMTNSINASSAFMLGDPRTNRMGFFDADWWHDTSPPVTLPDYPDGTSVGARTGWPVRISPSLSTSESVRSTGGIPPDTGYLSTSVYPGLLYENTESATRFEDRDGVVRIADGGFAPGDSEKVPTTPLLAHSYLPAYPADAISAGPNISRPRILDRAFRNVGELGYVFRDYAWKSLNFSSADSADAGLLDAFCLEDSEITAGKVNLNTGRGEIWQAILSGSLRREDDASTGLNDTQIATLAGNITQHIDSPSNEKFASIADFVRDFSTPANLPGSAFGGAANVALKVQREAVIRALAGSTQTRTWNVMIDLVAQTGRLPITATSLDQFMVEGERRYWLHLAIDRYTGEILDEHLEAVAE